MPASHVRAIRGATTVESDRAEEIRDATQALLREMCARNAIVPQDVISAIFTVTHDLRSDFPARAARELGWVDVPLLCMVEIDVPNALPHCVRVLLHIESSRARAEIEHVYLKGARALRPDLLRD
jgi:chorismate mutase